MNLTKMAVFTASLFCLACKNDIDTELEKKSIPESEIQKSEEKLPNEEELTPTDPDEETDKEETVTANVAYDFTGKTPPPAPQGMKWVKISQLSDEFNNGFNTTKWTKSLWNYGVPVQMKAENSGVSDGTLWIKATLGNDPERWFETSRIMSKAQVNYPMYTVSRIKGAHISAYNTFWLNNGDISNRNEIDVIENNSNPSCNCQPDFPWQMNSQYFHVVNDDTKRNKGNFDNRELSDANPLKGVAWNEEYHTFGVWWKDATHIQFYLDGEPAGSVVSARDFTRELNIIWDLWTVDADWLGGLAKKEHLSNDNINTMRIDWIHTYQLVEE
ncbi:family 16 glycosylhydrolase [Zobellia uliginosa]|uniref:family 16 glycosylhydrolase n=1 Tax=Zobellia uliginosa TaxID=143224 RepID=UPI0026E466AB|nr:family 16 glycosylhydrolase [Zobellia uliginosa]MDO6516658.1 family 16 glycosylhydrolase [Zobellia uliginosa]